MSSQWKSEGVEGYSNPDPAGRMEGTAEHNEKLRQKIADLPESVRKEREDFFKSQPEQR